MFVQTSLAEHGIRVGWLRSGAQRNRVTLKILPSRITTIRRARRDSSLRTPDG